MRLIILRKLLGVAMIVSCFYVFYFFGNLLTTFEVDVVRPHFSTIYSENFSNRNFKKVYIGMSFQEVNKLIGNPMYFAGETTNEEYGGVCYFYYYSDKKFSCFTLGFFEVGIFYDLDTNVIDKWYFYNDHD